MDLKEHYHELYKVSSQAILAEKYRLDLNIKNPSDSRFGITLLIRPDENIKANIKLFLDEIKAIDPAQYYYPDSDIHITVISIISCYEGFKLDKITVNDYVAIIQKSLVDIGKIKINFRGVTASPDALMLQGFPSDESLNNLRNNLRRNFKKSGLQHSIDSRYTIATAHSTVMRFQERLQNPEKLLEVVEKFKEFNFGEFTVENLELVYNDWYQREKNTVHLKNFSLK